ncbi:hypothetical protein SAMN04488072_106225 [Lentibacillus halodurans]|uniref:Phosphotransferase enzyme family protein n=1 Tax=Lentibacillus halodurans TaxID=237679 RepID=A0A1I0Y398_9BACI|nr:hypothetical protein SAMN04488072_106225 [Lentibacillus halodurans]
MNNIRSVLKHQYDVDIADIVPQQGGWSTLAYKVSDMNQRYFLKVYEKSRASTPKLTALIDQYMPIMVWLMHNSNLKGNITVPLLTVNGEYKCEDDVGIYLLYDYIDGETIGNRKLTEDQIQQFSEIIASLHFYGEEIPIETDSIKEDFQVPFLQLFRDILNDENKHIAGGVRKVVSPYVKQINDLVNTVEKLAIYLKNSDLKMALLSYGLALLEFNGI